MFFSNGRIGSEGLGKAESWGRELGKRTGSRLRGNPVCSSVLGTNPAAVVPAQAGTHNPQSFGYRWPCHIALLRCMGPCLLGDDSGESLLHIVFRRNERRSVQWQTQNSSHSNICL